MKLTEEQRNIVKDNSPFLQIIAGAGSGKTSTMVHLAERWKAEHSPGALLILTFSRKAAIEFQERLGRRAKGVRVQTFHAHCLEMLQKFSDYGKEHGLHVITEEEKINIWKHLLRKHKYEVGGIPFELLTGDTCNSLSKWFPKLEQMLWKEYASYKRKNGKVDFSDLISMYKRSLEQKSSWTEVARQCAKHLIVDEFQDTDWEQLHWLQLLRPKTLAVVGDDWQAIYGFRGATSRPFLDFPKYFPNVQRHFLTWNFRSSPSIVKASGVPIRRNKFQIQKQIRPVQEQNGTLEHRFFEDTPQAVQYLSEGFPNTAVILVRSNFRIPDFVNQGIPTSRVMTIHSSKGLEFESVAVDLMEGWNLDQDTNLEEERRILYVALSRAKMNLIVLGNIPSRQNALEREFFVDLRRDQTQRFRFLSLPNRFFQKSYRRRGISSVG